MLLHHYGGSIQELEMMDMHISTNMHILYVKDKTHLNSFEIKLTIKHERL